MHIVLVIVYLVAQDQLCIRDSRLNEDVVDVRRQIALPTISSGILYIFSSVESSCLFVHVAGR